MKGTVKWFSSSKGYGFIKNEETGKDIYVHFSDTMDKIQAMDKVIYDEFEGKKSLKAINVKRIKP